MKNKKRRKQFPSEASKLHAKNTRQKLSAGRDREREKEIERGRKIERERGGQIESKTETKLSAFDTGKCSLEKHEKISEKNGVKEIKEKC